MWTAGVVTVGYYGFLGSILSEFMWENRCRVNSRAVAIQTRARTYQTSIIIFTSKITYVLIISFPQHRLLPSVYTCTRPYLCDAHWHTYALTPTHVFVGVYVCVWKFMKIMIFSESGRMCTPSIPQLSFNYLCCCLLSLWQMMTRSRPSSYRNQHSLTSWSRTAWGVSVAASGRVAGLSTNIQQAHSNSTVLILHARILQASQLKGEENRENTL